MYRIMCAAVCSLALVACDTTTTVTPVEWQTVLAGEAGWEHLGGASLVQATTTGFQAIVELTNDEPGAVRPWHVHFNTCAEGGGIVGQDGAYPRLEIGADGTAIVSANIAQPLVADADYHVNVHLSNDELATIIACGDLVRIGG